jgi:multicomponent Na+:H+ antiporter subunit D
VLGIAVAGLSLIGVPGTVGFVSKWYLVLAALERGWWWLALVVVAGSAIAIAYVWRVVELACFAPSPAGRAEVNEAPWSMLASSWVLVLACVYFGLDTTLTADVASRAATALLGGLR